MDAKRDLVRIVELENAAKLNNPILVVGLPDAGLVGVIASSFLIDSFKMSEYAFVDSPLFPPIVVVHKGEPKSPVRLYANSEGTVVAMVSEVPLSLSVVNEIADAVIKFYLEKRCSLMVTVTGLQAPKRMEIEKPRVLAVPSTKELDKFLDQHGVEVMREGFIAGPYAILMKKAVLRKVPNILFLAESYYAYPDPGAAASVLEVMAKMFNLPIDVKPLLEQAEEIRLKARELMQKTKPVLAQSEKSHELSLPIMYA